MPLKYSEQRNIWEYQKEMHVLTILSSSYILFQL